MWKGHESNFLGFEDAIDQPFIWEIQNNFDMRTKGTLGGIWQRASRVVCPNKSEQFGFRFDGATDGEADLIEIQKNFKFS